MFPVLTSPDGLGWECVNKTNPTRAKDQSFWDFNPSCTVGLGSPPIFPTAAAWTPEVKEEIARSPGPEKRAPGMVEGMLQTLTLWVLSPRSSNSWREDSIPQQNGQSMPLQAHSALSFHDSALLRLSIGIKCAPAVTQMVECSIRWQSLSSERRSLRFFSLTYLPNGSSLVCLYSASFLRPSSSDSLCSLKRREQPARRSGVLAGRQLQKDAQESSGGAKRHQLCSEKIMDN